jgi:hypothetical protein
MLMMNNNVQQMNDKNVLEQYEDEMMEVYLNFQKEFFVKMMLENNYYHLILNNINQYHEQQTFHLFDNIYRINDEDNHEDVGHQ